MLNLISGEEEPRKRRKEKGSNEKWGRIKNVELEAIHRMEVHEAEEERKDSRKARENRGSIKYV